MIQQRELTHDVETLESNELDRLLRRDYRPRRGFRERVIHTPRHLWPSRRKIFERISARYDRIPPLDCDIIYGAVFYDASVPTTGKLYIDCLFLGGCRAVEPTGRWDMVDCNLFNALTMSFQVRSCTRIGMMPGNLIVDRPELEMV